MHGPTPSGIWHSLPCVVGLLFLSIEYARHCAADSPGPQPWAYNKPSNILLVDPVIQKDRRRSLAKPTSHHTPIKTRGDAPLAVSTPTHKTAVGSDRAPVEPSAKKWCVRPACFSFFIFSPGICGFVEFGHVRLSIFFFRFSSVRPFSSEPDKD